ncbi:hypothetical protein FQ087_18180 [Sporosarcina sp. ANT_H38]|uniref:hypothetical protein n=1 Tax=Sporosarcina sp. ANT_H38 TaxID=2597358 RepID=UPI0011F3C5C7|nr:hypothetical protein [Sporosarcina sp. ANT_H38]KAA0944054.1 hypothetical protein FQ087_18180 [Sporosarcina sp. ANT_H38]
MSKEETLLVFIELQKKFIENSQNQALISAGVRRKKPDNTSNFSNIFSKLHEGIKEYETVR